MRVQESFRPNEIESWNSRHRLDFRRFLESGLQRLVLEPTLINVLSSSFGQALSFNPTTLIEIAVYHTSEKGLSRALTG